ncbi:peptidylprolyl isomerase [Candidatus Woesearchaeota archaeon]|nr:peptidylprolyl isomerase [Candidatus Woesearchaeota archaeon]MCF7901591.1 peptidylprolyl isomerase [Candidatus Woesearchaeota archaeon]MCF8013644.1 peptidylprolyl isomerase [Candidatus Woesearchaeota archaeon]
MAIKKGDFIQLDYTGKIQETNTVFDTTILKTAEDAGLIHKHGPNDNHDHSDQYSPVTICVGEKQLLPGLDEQVEGKEIGKYNIKVPTEKAFGKKNPKLLKIMPIKLFKEQNIKPYVGLQLNIDGQMGTVRSITGGRTIVDFNHPLTSKDLEYDIEIKKIVTDKKEQVQAILKLTGIPIRDLEIKDKKAIIKMNMELPPQMVEQLNNEIKRLTSIEIEVKNQQNEAK